MFFNGPHGYRTAYYRSRECGVEANALFLRTLLPRLVAYHVAQCPEDLNVVKTSLLAGSAKAWLAECGKEICRQCIGQWSSASCDDAIEIINGRWEAVKSQHGRWGRKAWPSPKSDSSGHSSAIRDTSGFPPKRRTVIAISSIAGGASSPRRSEKAKVGLRCAGLPFSRGALGGFDLSRRHQFRYGISKLAFDS